MNIKRIIGATLAALLLAALLALPAAAKVVSPGESFYFLDQADVLSEATEGEIFFSNQLLEEACGAQIVVVAINTTGSEAIDDYAYDLFNDWGIGDAQKQNGFLLLLTIKDDNYYALCGSNLQSKLTAGVLDQYFDDYLEADFAAKRYDAGVQKFFEAVFARIADIYNARVTVEQGVAAYEAWLAEGQTTQMVATGSGARGAMAPAREEGASMGLIVFVVVLIIVLAVLTPARRRWRRRRGIFVAPPPPPPPGPGPIGPGPIGRGGRRGFGSGLFRSSGVGSSRPSSGGLFGGGSSRPSGGSFGSSRSSGSSFGASRSSGSSRSSFGSARGGGGGTRGGGAGRGRH